MNKIGTYISLILSIIIILFLIIKFLVNNEVVEELKIDLTDLTYGNKATMNKIKKYSQDDYMMFLDDYYNSNLPEVYITEFLFDGVSMYKNCELSDYIDNGNDFKSMPYKINVINIDTNGDIHLSGERTGSMLAVNTNNISGNINLLLDNVNIDTDSKYVPAIWIYNRNVTYSDAKVTIKTLNNTNNYIKGGNLKRVSLMPSNELDKYIDEYSETNLINFEKYTNYYGVYTSDEINNILFAKMSSNNEDLQKGYPYYVYNASGTISSDIDLFFEGYGYLEIIGYNNKGIETKGNLSFDGGDGDYVISSNQNSLHTISDNNNITINVKSLYAIVDNEMASGNAIDSNGNIVINNGLIIANGKTNNSTGLYSKNETYINNGVVISTGGIYDEISTNSKQNFIVFSFTNEKTSDDLITMLDYKNNVLFAYRLDDTYSAELSYSNLLYSSPILKKGTYYLYKDGVIDGDIQNGFYIDVSSYEKGMQLACNVNELSDVLIKNKYDNNTKKESFIIDGVSNLFNNVDIYEE